MAKSPVQQKLKKSVGKNSINKTKRVYTKLEKRRIKGLLVALSIVLVFCIFSISHAVSNAIEMKHVLAEKQRILEIEENKKRILESDLAKLDDPEYISQFMSDEYLYTSDGEYLFILPEDDTTTETTTNNEETTSKHD